MLRSILGSILLAIAAGSAAAQVKLVIVEPGHFHASLIQRDMYPQVAPQVSVYAPLGPELLDYLARVGQFNARAENPTRWELEIHTSAGYFDRMLKERSGNVVVFAGKNREKIGRILRSLEAGYHVLADKPWIIGSEDLPRLQQALDLAESKRLAAYDIMTERFEITNILQKELVNAPEVFGELARGDASNPAITARSIHYLMKTVAGAPLKRPSWFLNIDEVGEGMADVGTHVVDLVQWTAFPARQLDYRKDVEVTAAKRWPTVVSHAQFTQVTGDAQFPAHLAKWVKDDRLNYYANHTIGYAVAGVHVGLDIRWDWEAAPGAGDVYEATFRGSRARVEIRQGQAEKFRPELYVVPEKAARQQVFDALRKKVAGWQKDWPGVEAAIGERQAHISIPEKYRVGHEAHFAQVTRAFLGYVQDPRTLPGWEKSNMMVKYFVTTKGVELSRRLTP